MKLDFENLSSEQTKELNAYARSLLVDYTAFIDTYSKCYGAEKYWWCLPMVCRNLTNSSVFYQLCRILFAIDCVKKSNNITEIQVKTKEEKQCLLRYFRRDSKKIRVCSYNEGESVFRLAAKGLYIYFREFIGYYISIKRVLKEKQIPLNRPINLICTPTLSSYVGDEVYKDRYFNDIHTLSDEELYFLPCMSKNDNTSISEYAKKLQNVKNYNFILGEQFLKIYDYFQIILYWNYCLKNSHRKFFFHTICITSLTRRSMLEGLLSTSSFRGILDDKILYRMKQSGIIIRNFIIWYEGRPADLYDIMLYGKHFPNGRSVAYEGLPFDELEMSYAPTKEMMKQGITASVYGVPGEHYIKMVNKYKSGANIISLPILRNEYSVKHHIMNKKPKRILFILSFFHKDVISQLKYANAIAKEYGRNIEIMIKNHPVNINNKVEDILDDELFFTPNYVTGVLSDCLVDVDAAVIFNGSTTALEVLYASVPLIIINPNGEIVITSVPENIDKNLYCIVYNKHQFIKKIKVILDMNGERYNKCIEGLFVRKTEENVKRMFV